MWIRNMCQQVWALTDAEFLMSQLHDANACITFHAWCHHSSSSCCTRVCDHVTLFSVVAVQHSLSQPRLDELMWSLEGLDVLEVKLNLLQRAGGQTSYQVKCMFKDSVLSSYVSCVLWNLIFCCLRFLSGLLPDGGPADGDALVEDSRFKIQSFIAVSNKW